MPKAQGPTYDVLPTLLAMGVSGGCSVGLLNISVRSVGSPTRQVGWPQMKSSA